MIKVTAFPHTLISNSNMFRSCNNGCNSIPNVFTPSQSQLMLTFLPKSWNIIFAGHTRALIGPGGGA